MISATTPRCPAWGRTVIVGVNDLVFQAVRKEDTTDQDVERLHNAIILYAAASEKANSNNTSSELKHVQEARSVVRKAMNCVRDVQIIRGSALWNILPSASRPPAKFSQSDTEAASGIAPRQANNTTKKTRDSKILDDSFFKNSPRSKVHDQRTDWEKLKKLLPAPAVPSQTWLTEVRDIAAQLNPQEKVVKMLGEDLWSKLVFLNDDKYGSRMSTRKGPKMHISKWDLVPEDIAEPCRACGTKFRCQWPSADDHTKCRECWLQGKGCIRSQTELLTNPRKRKRVDPDDENGESDRRLSSEPSGKHRRLGADPIMKDIAQPKLNLLKASSSKERVQEDSRCAKNPIVATESPEQGELEASPIHPSHVVSEPKLPFVQPVINPTGLNSPPVHTPTVRATSIFAKDLGRASNLAVPGAPLVDYGDSPPRSRTSSPDPTCGSPNSTNENVAEGLKTRLARAPLVNYDDSPAASQASSPSQLHGRPTPRSRDEDELRQLFVGMNYEQCKREMAGMKADLHTALGNACALMENMRDDMKREKDLLAVLKESRDEYRNVMDGTVHALYD